MKFLAFLLSVFFMVLTVVPCSDTANFFGDKTGVAEEVHLQQGQAGHADQCAPFCVCNCCGMSMTVTQIKKLLPEKNFLLVKAEITESTYNYSLLFNAGIWQPPKLC
ncbi:hypothetical protein FIC_01133 [Flavobacteriaceae bacterium 3519-10]|nr:hypothetical protein FIC_01133 [Flavobacteriaceae bacterium 3519-10]